MSGAVESRLSQGSPDAPRACLVCGSQKLASRFCTECGTERVSPVIVTHAVGPLWAVNGHVLTVAPGEDLRRTIIGTVAVIANAAAPVPIVVTDGPRVTRVILRLDGSSVAEGDDAPTWAGTRVQPVPAARPRPSVAGVHAGSGASTWALLLYLSELRITDEPSGPVVLVCRSTPAGINATKAAIHTLGTDAIDAVLVVADAPGKPVPAAAREQKVLAGAVPVVAVPWLPRLRAVAEISPALAGQLARPVQRVTKALQGAQTAKKEKA